MEWVSAVLQVIWEAFMWVVNREGGRGQCPEKFLQELRHAREWQRKARSASSEDDRQDAIEEVRIAIRQAIRLGLRRAPATCPEDLLEAAAIAEEVEELAYAEKAYSRMASRCKSDLCLKASVCLAELKARQGQKIEAQNLVDKVLRADPRHPGAVQLKQELDREEEVS
jgi:tetratricopeptide (TPR) repeat protein